MPCPRCGADDEYIEEWEDGRCFCELCGHVWKCTAPSEDYYYGDDDEDEN